MPLKSKLTQLNDAREAILASLEVRSGVESVTLLQAVGRILAEAIHAPVDVPPADNSAMDGYAVRAAEVQQAPVTLPVSQRIPAGTAGGPLRPGTTARIFTGAPLPEGADAVVMQENTENQNDRVTILQQVSRGENVRCQGEDIARGTSLISAGCRLRVTDMHVLSACGIAELKVRKALRVALLTTGDELVRPGTALRPGQIYNSNYYVIASLLHRLGMEVLDLGVVADDLAATESRLLDAAARADCIISSGGVSVGEEDHVRQAVQNHGTLGLWRLAVKPGKPFAYGAVQGIPFFGLPGNPVSAFVTFVLLVKPALLKLGGGRSEPASGIKLPAEFDLTSGERQEFLRVRLVKPGRGDTRLELCANQSSGAGSSLSQADGLAVLPAFTTVKAGDMLEFISFSELTD